MIILASSSPRRINILKNLKIRFQAVSPDIDESKYIDKNTVKAVKTCALEKVKFVMRNLDKKEWIAGFDTLVEIGNIILSKPVNRADAENMLKKLSGRVHHVHTGVAVSTDKSDKIITDACTTEVFFNKMTDKDINFYLDTKEWEGAAGAYRIQERGAFFINKIIGSYSNVVGLPISLFYGMLCKYNFPF